MPVVHGFKPITAAEAAFAKAKLERDRGQAVCLPFCPVESERVSAVPVHAAQDYTHRVKRCSHATFSEQYMRQLFRSVTAS